METEMKIEKETTQEKKGSEKEGNNCGNGEGGNKVHRRESLLCNSWSNVIQKQWM